jgi:hypothetical protein
MNSDRQGRSQGFSNPASQIKRKYRKNKIILLLKLQYLASTANVQRRNGKQVGAQAGTRQDKVKEKLLIGRPVRGAQHLARMKRQNNQVETKISGREMTNLTCITTLYIINGTVPRS